MVAIAPCVVGESSHAVHMAKDVINVLVVHRTACFHLLGSLFEAQWCYR